MYPSTIQIFRSDRANVDNELASFYAGTQFRTFKEITLAPAGVYVVKMMRPIDIIIRSFTMHINSGEMRCDIYRNATLSGTFSDVLPVIQRNETALRPTPLYQPKCSLSGGGSASDGTLYDIMDVKTSGASGQAATVGDENVNQLGAPANSVGTYKFSNPGNASATCVFAMWWEELP